MSTQLFIFSLLLLKNAWKREREAAQTAQLARCSGVFTQRLFVLTSFGPDIINSPEGHFVCMLWAENRTSQSMVVEKLNVSVETRQTRSPQLGLDSGNSGRDAVLGGRSD